MFDLIYSSHKNLKTRTMKKRKVSSSSNNEDTKSINRATNEGCEEEKEEDALDDLSYIDGMLNFPDNLEVFNNEEMESPTKTNEDHSDLLEAVGDKSLELSVLASIPQMASMNSSDPVIHSHCAVTSNSPPTTSRHSTVHAVGRACKGASPPSMANMHASDSAVDSLCEEDSKVPPTTSKHSSEPVVDHLCKEVSSPPMASMYSLEPAVDRRREEALSDVPLIANTDPKGCGIRQAPCGPSEIELRNCPHDRAKQALISWYENLAKFYKFVEEFGHANVPTKYKDKSLVNWVNKQRFEYRQKQSGKGSVYLTDKKLSELNKAGFNWPPPKDVWEERFVELKEFERNNGHCMVPTKYKKNRKLGRWVSVQRRKYKEGKLDDHRIQKFNDIGFSWSPQSTKTINNTLVPEGIEKQEEQTAEVLQSVDFYETIDPRAVNCGLRVDDPITALVKWFLRYLSIKE